MATLSSGVTALARQVALDQIAQDIDFNAKVNAKADTSVVTALQETVSGQAAQLNQINDAFAQFNSENGVSASEGEQVKSALDFLKGGGPGFAEFQVNSEGMLTLVSTSESTTEQFSINTNGKLEITYADN